MDKVDNITVPINQQEIKDKRRVSEVYRDSKFRSEPNLNYAVVKSPNKSDRFVIQFDNKFKVIWDIFIAIVLLFIIFYYPVFLSFCLDVDENE